MRAIPAVAAIVLFWSCAATAEWSGITPDNRVGGRVASAGYLRGKVVLFDRRDYADPANADDLRRLQSAWSAYKTKAFVLLGCHTGGDSAAAKKAVEKLGLTYPVYINVECSGPFAKKPPERGAPAADEPAAGPSGASDARIVLFDATGRRLLYCGDNAALACGSAGKAVFDERQPSGVVRWKELIDYDLENLPGRALSRLRDLHGDSETLAKLEKRFPADAARFRKEFERLRNDKEAVELAKLEDEARSVVDADPRSAAASGPSARRFDEIASRYSHLKTSRDGRVAQEAKNALADVAFAKATFKAQSGGKGARPAARKGGRR